MSALIMGNMPPFLASFISYCWNAVYVLFVHVSNSDFPITIAAESVPPGSISIHPGLVKPPFTYTDSTVYCTHTRELQHAWVNNNIYQYNNIDW